MIEDGKTIMYDVYRKDQKIGEFKRLAPGIDMIVNTSTVIGSDLKEYKITNKFTRETVWTGADVNKRAESRYISQD